jgi:hypothetical protein
LGQLPAKARANFPLAALARFCIEHFQCDGMLLVGALLINHPELAIALLSREVAKAAFLLWSNDIQNGRAYLRFVQFVIAASDGLSVQV